MNNAKSWKTTVGGIGMILAGLAYFASVLSGEVSFSMEGAMLAFGTLSGGVSLVFAKDKDVTGAAQADPTRPPTR